MTHSTFTRFAVALAIGTSVLATSGVANARGGSYGGGGGHYSVPIVRDHRGPDGVPQGGVTVTTGTPTSQGGYWGRGGHGGYSAPISTPIIRDHRSSR